MAQVLQQNQQNNQDDKVKSNAPTLSSAQTANINAPSVQQAPQGPRTAGSGRFQNLQKFIGANTQAPKEYEEKISGKISSQAQNVQQQTQQKQQAVQQAKQAEQTRLNQAQGLVSQIPTQASQLVQDEGKLAQLDQLRNLQYNKDINLGDTSQLQQDLSKVGGLAEMTTSEEGRKQLLRDVYGQTDPRKYGSGASRLDQLLLQADPESAGRLIGSAEQQFGDVQSGFQGAQRQAQEYQDLVAKLATEGKTALEGATTSGMEGIRSDLSGRMAQHNEAIQQQSAILNRALNQGQISRAEFNTLDSDLQNALKGIEGQHLAGTKADLGAANLLTEDNMQRLATADEATRQRALERIANTPSSFLKGQIGLEAGDLDVSNIGNLSGFLSSRAKGAQAAQSDLDRRLAEVDKYEQEQIGKLGDVYYDKFGRHTGQGTQAGYRDPRDFLKRSLGDENVLRSEEFRKQYLDPYGYDEAQYGNVVDELIRASRGVGQDVSSRRAKERANRARFGKLFKIV